jgi:hypothetical protein
VLPVGTVVNVKYNSGKGYNPTAFEHVGEGGFKSSDTMTYDAVKSDDWTVKIVTLPGVGDFKEPSLSDVKDAEVGTRWRYPTGASITKISDVYGDLKYEVVTSDGTLKLYKAGMFAKSAAKNDEHSSEFAYDPPDQGQPESDAAHEEGAQPQADAPASVGPFEYKLDFYTSAYGSGGKYKHHEISDLKPGEWFRDKSKKKFVVVAQQAGSTLFQELGNLQTFSSPWKVGGKQVRVRKVEGHA